MTTNQIARSGRSRVIQNALNSSAFGETSLFPYEALDVAVALRRACSSAGVVGVRTIHSAGCINLIESNRRD